MKLVFVITIVIVLKACSFDNKSGIWRNDKGSVVERKIFRILKIYQVLIKILIK